MEIKVCRICGKQDDNFIHIFKTEGLRNKIETCLPIVVTHDCPLPDTICTTCLDNVDNFYSFIKNCLQNIIVLEAQYEIIESCLKTKRKVDRSVSVDPCELTQASLLVTSLIKCEKLDDINGVTHQNALEVKTEPTSPSLLTENTSKTLSGALVDYDFSSESDASDNEIVINEFVPQKKSDKPIESINNVPIKSSSTSNCNKIEQKSDIITEIVQRKFLKRKNDVEIFTSIAAKVPKHELTAKNITKHYHTNHQTNYSDSTSRRKNSRPKRVEYHLESKKLQQLVEISSPPYHHHSQQQQHNVRMGTDNNILLETNRIETARVPVAAPTAASVVPVVQQQQQLMQMCLLCEQQLPGLLALATHMYETHGIDMSQVYASSPTTMPMNLSQNLNSLRQCERLLVPSSIQQQTTQMHPQSISAITCKNRKIPELVKISDVLSNRRLNNKTNNIQELMYQQQQLHQLQQGLMQQQYDEQLPVPVLEVQGGSQQQIFSNNKKQQRSNEHQQQLQQLFICSECPANRQRQFTSFSEFSTHRRAQHQIFHCDLCPKFYGRNSHLWKHVNRVHKGHEAITCRECGKTSASEYHLAQHRNKMHSSSSVQLSSGGGVTANPIRKLTTKVPGKVAQQKLQRQQQQKRNKYQQKSAAVNPSEAAAATAAICKAKVNHILRSNSAAEQVAVHMQEATLTNKRAAKCHETASTKVANKLIRCDDMQIDNKIKDEDSNESDDNQIITNDIEDEDDLLNQKFQGFDFKSVRQSFLKQELISKQQRLVSVLKTNNHLCDSVDNNKKKQQQQQQHNNITTCGAVKGDPKTAGCASFVGAPKEIDSSSDLYTTIITNYTPPTNEGPYKCPKCFKGFHKKNLLKKHKKNCRPRLQKDLLTRCKTCSRIFKDRQSLAKHLVNYHSEYTCEICNVAVQSKCEIVSHIRFTHPNSLLECHCGQILRSKADLVRHKADHRDSHVCQFCGDALPTKIKLKMHILSLHRKILALSCGICLRLFESQHVLRAHVRHAHADQLRPLTSCTVCGKNYGSKWKTYDHLNKSHGRIFRACKACLEVFENERELQQHFEREHINNSNNNSVVNTVAASATAAASAANNNCNITVTAINQTNSNNIKQKEQQKNIAAHKEKYNSKPIPPSQLTTAGAATITTIGTGAETELDSDDEQIDDKDEDEDDEEEQSQHDEELSDVNATTKANYSLLVSATNELKQNGLPNSKLSLLEKRLLGKKVLNTSSETPASSATVTTTTTTTTTNEEHHRSTNNNKKESVDAANVADFVSNNDDILQNSSKRTVYVNSNDPSLCEICLKVWPAKKHLWQHYIRCHKQTAATVCGICLKTNPSYAALQRHLRQTHPRLLHGCGFGSNFICKICGRYHNASSKLRLHMAIHVGYNGDNEAVDDDDDDDDHDAPVDDEEETASAANEQEEEDNDKEDDNGTSVTAANKQIQVKTKLTEDEAVDTKLVIKQESGEEDVEEDEGSVENTEIEINKIERLEQQREIKQESEDEDGEEEVLLDAEENNMRGSEESESSSTEVQQIKEEIKEEYENIINYESLIEEIEASDGIDDVDDDADNDDDDDNDDNDEDAEEHDKCEDGNDSTEEINDENNIDDNDETTRTTEYELEQEMLKNMIGESRTVKLSRIKLVQSVEEHAHANQKSDDDDEDECDDVIIGQIVDDNDDEDDDADDDEILEDEDEDDDDVTAYELEIIDENDDNEEIIDGCMEFVKHEIIYDDDGQQQQPPPQQLGQLLMNNELDSAIRSICDEDLDDEDQLLDGDAVIPIENSAVISGAEIYRRLVVAGGRVNESELETAVGSIL